jgi:aspartate aminotransferase
MSLAQRAKLLKPSPILMLAARANELKAQGQNVISLSIGEPDWETYENIKEAGIEAIRGGATKYTPPSGIPDLKRAIAAQVSRDLKLDYSPTEVTVTTGAKFILFSALQCLVDPGDEVLLIAPFWASYTTMVELADGVPRVVLTSPERGFKATAAELEAAITPKTKALILNSPSNPTGMVYSEAELKALADVIRRHPRLHIISDDIYNRLVFDSPSDVEVAPHLLHVAPDLRSRVVVMNGASKSYAMTGWRIGWALGPSEIINAMSNYQSQSVSCATGVSQVAAVEAVRNSQASVRGTIEKLKQRRDFILEQLATIPGLKVYKPDGAFYLWLDLRAFLGLKGRTRLMQGSADLASALLDEHLVAAVPGVEFGLEGYMRLSYALENSRAKEAVDRMRTFFAELRK